MTADNSLQLPLSLPLEASNGGFFVSRGRGRHQDRVLGSFELIFVSSGVLGLQEAGRHFSVQAGETLLLWPGRPHGGTAPYPANLSFYWLHFYLEPLTPHVSGEMRVPQHTRVSRPDHLTNLFRRFLDDQETLTVHAACSEFARYADALRGYRPLYPACPGERGSDARRTCGHADSHAVS